MDLPTALNLCPLCPEGQTSDAPNDMIVGAEAPALLKPCSTCGSVEKEVFPFLNQTQCDEATEELETARIVCDCLDVWKFDHTCPDGAPMRQPDLTIDLDHWATPAPLDAADSLTCKDLGPNVRDLSSNQEEHDSCLVCCGCHVDVGAGDVELPNSICTSGHPLDPAFVDVPIHDFGDACGSLALELSLLIADQVTHDREEFSKFFYCGRQLCGCEDNRFFCDVCEDGSVIQPVTEDDCVNCACLAGLAFLRSPSDQLCSCYQGWGECCGCNDPVANEGACRLCGDDTLLSHVWSDSETTFLGSADDPHPCRECEVTNFLFEEFNNGLQLTCDERRERTAEECCSSSFSPLTGPTTTTGPSSSPSSSPSFSPSSSPSTAPATTTTSPTTSPATSPTASPAAKPTNDNSSGFRASISKKSLLITVSAVLSTFVFGV